MRVPRMCGFPLQTCGFTLMRSLVIFAPRLPLDYSEIIRIGKCKFADDPGAKLYEIVAQYLADHIDWVIAGPPSEARALAEFGAFQLSETPSRELMQQAS